jgi:polyhydroxybutyrate depolymerase
MRKVPVRVMGVQRSYLIHIPGSYDSARPLPLVVVLHGAFSTAKEAEIQTGFSELADRENIIVIYPNGAFGILGFFQHWNAGHCCGRAADDNIDDVGFLDMVIADVRERFNIDKNRLYLVGFSNGGMLTYRYAAERSEAVAAIASVAASIGGRVSQRDDIWVIPAPAHTVPLISFHGKDDQNVPYNGGRSPLKGGTREYFSVEQSIDFWVINNKCNHIPRLDKPYSGMITRQIWTECNNKNSMIMLYSLEPWGHVWPGRIFTEKLDDTHPLKGFDAAEIIWEFFKMHQRE